jgi:hypothetical protein
LAEEHAALGDGNLLKRNLEVLVAVEGCIDESLQGGIGKNLRQGMMLPCCAAPLATVSVQADSLRQVQRGAARGSRCLWCFACCHPKAQ